MTTVGYNEIHPLSQAGRIFNSFLILFGVTTIFIAIGAVTQTVIELEFGDVLNRRRSKRMIEQLKDHFIICGYGRVGRGAAEELMHEGAPFVVVDTSPERVERAMLSGMLAVSADATRDDTLRQVGITRARGLVAALATDADNLFVLLSAKGLNPGIYVAARAAEEAFHVNDILGPRLIAFQLGNEPDAWRNRYRPASWTYADYWKEWIAAHAAVAARVPGAKFAGPDVSNKMAYVTGFAANIKDSAADVVLLTSHYYAMGPAGAKDVTLDKLLSPDPKLERDLTIAMEAAHAAGIPYRMSEGNSCWNGGEPGVSDTLASALWAADTMLDFASFGCAGVNMALAVQSTMATPIINEIGTHNAAIGTVSLGR